MTTTNTERVKTMVVFDLEGSGYSILWTADGKLWASVSKYPLNRAQVERYVDNCRMHSPNADIREVKDFYCRLPEDLITPETRTRR